MSATRRDGRGRLMLRPVLLSVLWGIVLMAAALGASQSQTVFREGGWDVEGDPPYSVAHSLSDGFTGRGETNISLAVTDDRYQAESPEFRNRVEQVISRVRDMDSLRVTSHVGWADGGSGATDFLGSDGRTVLTLVGSDLTSSDAPRVLPEAQAALDAEFAPQGVHPVLLSVDSFWGEINRASEQGLAHAEMLALPLILFVLLLLYRSVVASLVSVAMAAVAIILTLGMLALIGRVVDLSSFTMNAVTMVGLGVCIDYSLFVVRRFQQELQAGRDRHEALLVTRRTASRTVLASGLTVALALIMLLVVDLPIIRSLALGGVLVVLSSVAVCTSLLPLLLRFLGPRINSGRIPLHHRRKEGRSEGPSRLSRSVTRHPVLFLVLGGVLLGVAALPATQLTTFTPDVRIVDGDKSVRQGYDRVAVAFSIGSTAPLQVLMTARDGSLADLDPREVREFVARLEETRGVESVVTTLPAMSQASEQNPLRLADPALRSLLPEPEQKLLGAFVSDDGDRMLIEVRPDGWGAGREAQEALREVESLIADSPVEGATIEVGGETAQGVASNRRIGLALPWVLGGMTAVIFLLLAVTFRSLLVPAVAVVLNMLSVGATYGIMVLVFQEGFGTELFGYTQMGYIQNFVPVLLLALLFSLATDYQVFLMAQVKEYRDAGWTNIAAIAHGVTRTAPLITGAAFLMLVVFGAFSFTGIIPIQQLGFGLAVGIFLDATVVRVLMLPAALTLGRSATWWPGVRGADRVRSEASSGSGFPGGRPAVGTSSVGQRAPINQGEDTAWR